MRLRDFCVVMVFFSTVLFAQRRVDPKNIYHRVIAVLPLVGSGTHGDPLRPKYAPGPQPGGPSPNGIIAFAFELSDDGKHAIAELVAVDRSGLAAVLNDHDAGVLVFEKGTVTPTEIETAIRQYRKDFSLSRFGVALQ